MWSVRPLFARESGRRLQHSISTAGSQRSGPTVGGLMYCAEGSLAPRGLFKAGPPGIPGRPRPAPEKTGVRPDGPPGSS